MVLHPVFSKAINRLLTSWSEDKKGVVTKILGEKVTYDTYTKTKRIFTLSEIITSDEH